MMLDFIVKLGGSAITQKDELETLKEADLKRTAEILAACFKHGKQFVVVHGAGSFGHHQARHFGVNFGFHGKSSAEKNKVMEGYCKTRVSVTKLNQMVVQYLVAADLPAVGLSASNSWLTNDGVVVEDGTAAVKRHLANGFVPVLHGDCVLDQEPGCTVLSGDTIIQTLCSKMNPKQLVFLTDVAGIFDRPPQETGAQLLSCIHVDSDGQLRSSIRTNMNSAIDCTGGISLKLKTAAAVVHGGRGDISVTVCSLKSLQDVCLLQSSPAFLGTHVLWTGGGDKCEVLQETLTECGLDAV